MSINFFNSLLSEQAIPLIDNELHKALIYIVIYVLDLKMINLATDNKIFY